MKKRYRIAGSILIFLALAFAVLAVLISHTSSCTPGPALAAGLPSMRAVVRRCYGPPSVMTLETTARPAPADDVAIIRVHAASVNPLDWHFLRGEPYPMRLQTGLGTPKDPRLGVDFAGTVESVGKSVRRLKPGDEVFGGSFGSFGEYVRADDADAVVSKPPNISFAEAAAVPIAGITALQALRDQGHLQAGQKVLVNGASGGVGTFAVQLAKNMGAHVTGVCSTRNVELVKSLGAERVIDYKAEDFTRGNERYQLIIDTVGNHPLDELERVLEPGGIGVMIGGPSDGPWLGALKGPIHIKTHSTSAGHQFKFFIARMNQQDLGELAGMLQAGKIRSVIDRSYPLEQTAQAIAYLEEGHARGKVVIAVSP